MQSILQCFLQKDDPHSTRLVLESIACVSTWLTYIPDKIRNSFLVTVQMTGFSPNKTSLENKGWADSPLHVVSSCLSKEVSSRMVLILSNPWPHNQCLLSWINVLPFPCLKKSSDHGIQLQCSYFLVVRVHYVFQVTYWIYPSKSLGMAEQLTCSSLSE